MKTNLLFLCAETDDYDRSQLMMTVPRCATRQCIVIRTLDDCRFEGNEEFKVNLQLVNTPTTIIKANGSDSLTVSIEDNDSKMHFYESHSR